MMGILYQLGLAHVQVQKCATDLTAGTRDNDPAKARATAERLETAAEKLLEHARAIRKATQETAPSHVDAGSQP